MTLTEFLAARLDEDEAIARAAVPERCTAGWQAGQPDPDAEPGPRSETGRSNMGSVRDTCWVPSAASEFQPLGHVVVYDEGSPTVKQAAHIARHDPARAFREVAAGRAILATLSPILGDGINFTIPERNRAEDMLRALAATWEDHPGYSPALALPATDH